MNLLAARSASLLNIAELSRSIALPHTTLTRYPTRLDRAFLVRRAPAWAGNRARRTIKTPRVWIPDTGLLGHLAGLTPPRLAEEPVAVGPLLETFVVSEIAKQIGWSRTRVDLFHFRTHGGREVDIVIEAEDGRLVGVEVKAAATIGPGDLKRLTALREVAGKRFPSAPISGPSRSAPSGSSTHGALVSDEFLQAPRCHERTAQTRRAVNGRNSRGEPCRDFSFWPVCPRGIT